MRRAAFAAGLAVLCAALARGAQAADSTHVALVDQTGARFTFADLRGGPVIVTFVATRCSDACPIADGIFARLAQRNLRARLVTITLDPRYDTPFVMAHYARELGADRRRWIIASGRERDVEAIIRAFGVVAGGAPSVHSTFAYLIDKQGRLARTLPLSTNTEGDVTAWLRSAP